MEMMNLLSSVPKDEMYKLSDYYVEMFDHIKECDKELYDKIYFKTYSLVYGEVLNDELAKCKVKEMKPYGEHWTCDQTTSVGKQYGIDFTFIKESTLYYVMNMMYNDYSTVLGNDTALYIKMAKAWLYDEDCPYDGNEKTFRYVMF